MYLFITIAIVCLLLTVSPDIIKLLQVTKWFKKESNTFAEELRLAREELERVKTTPASGEYAQFVKTMRAQQKVKDVEDKIRSERNMGRLKNASAELIAGYGLRAVFSLVLVVISIRNRYTPVMVFNERINFQPLQGLLSFPTGIPNAISVPVWVLSCNVTFRLFSSLIRAK